MTTEFVSRVNAEYAFAITEFRYRAAILPGDIVLFFRGRPSPNKCRAYANNAWIDKIRGRSSVSHSVAQRSRRGSGNFRAPHHPTPPRGVNFHRVTRRKMALKSLSRYRTRIFGCMIDLGVEVRAVEADLLLGCPRPSRRERPFSCGRARSPALCRKRTRVFHK